MPGKLVPNLVLPHCIRERLRHEGRQASAAPRHSRFLCTPSSHPRRGVELPCHSERSAGEGERCPSAAPRGPSRPKPPHTAGHAGATPLAPTQPSPAPTAPSAGCGTSEHELPRLPLRRLRHCGRWSGQPASTPRPLTARMHGCRPGLGGHPTPTGRMRQHCPHARRAPITSNPVCGLASLASLIRCMSTLIPARRLHTYSGNGIANQKCVYVCNLDVLGAFPPAGGAA